MKSFTLQKKEKSLDRRKQHRRTFLVMIKSSILEKRVAKTPAQMLQPLPYSHYLRHLMRADNQHGEVSMLVADAHLIGDCIHMALCKLP